MPDRVALLLDGGFVTKRLQARTGRYPSVADVVALARGTLAKQDVMPMALLRIFYYDAEPYDGVVTHPIDGSQTDFGRTSRARISRALLAGLELEPGFAVRRGTLIMSGWKLGNRASDNLRQKAAAGMSFEPRDVVPDVRQKDVDLKIGLDIAWISLKRLADCLVLVTGDSDFVPAMKFARREGLKVFLEPLGHAYLHRDLRVHADRVL